MDKCAYLVNSTPKYYYLLELHFTLVRRYAPFIKHLFLATEVPEDSICQRLVKEFGVELIPLKGSEAGFLDSRHHALRQLALSGRFRYVLPMQEDFLLDRVPDLGALEEACSIMELSKNYIASMRLMPCPGPNGPMFESYPLWAGILPTTDTYGFTFQATLWSLDACCDWYRAISNKLEEDYPVSKTAPDQRRHIEIRANFAENPDGQKFFWEFFHDRQQTHLGWIRAGTWPNAVYLSPWPYRPTAIVQGNLVPWAAEMGEREGVMGQT
jgi:hypothetical protein